MRRDLPGRASSPGAMPDKWARTWRERFASGIRSIWCPSLEDEQEEGDLRGGRSTRLWSGCRFIVTVGTCILLYDELLVAATGMEHLLTAPRPGPGRCR